MKVIGLDIGGTTIKGAVVNGSDIIKTYSVNTESKYGRDRIIKNIFNVIDKLQAVAGKNAPIGIGSAGDVDPLKGRIVYSTGNLPDFTGLELKEIVQKKYNVKVAVVNDAMAALIGEMQYGAGKNYKNIVMITLGTGVGGGVAINGKILVGNNYKGARLGHVCLHSNGRQCNCGRIGCVEQYISATGIISTAHEVSLPVNTANEFFDAVKTGDIKAQRGMRLFIDDLCLAVTNFITIFDPEVLIIGGGIVEIKDKWWYNYINQFDNENRTKIVPAQLGNKAGILGSSYLATIDNNIFIKD